MSSSFSFLLNGGCEEIGQSEKNEVKLCQQTDSPTQGGHFSLRVTGNPAINIGVSSQSKGSYYLQEMAAYFYLAVTIF